MTCTEGEVKSRIQERGNTIDKYRSAGWLIDASIVLTCIGSSIALVAWVS